jgi:hypothetical protein
MHVNKISNYKLVVLSSRARKIHLANFFFFLNLNKISIYYILAVLFRAELRARPVSSPLLPISHTTTTPHTLKTVRIAPTAEGLCAMICASEVNERAREVKGER